MAANESDCPGRPECATDARARVGGAEWATDALVLSAVVISPANVFICLIGGRTMRVSANGG